MPDHQSSMIGVRGGGGRLGGLGGAGGIPPNRPHRCVPASCPRACPHPHPQGKEFLVLRARNPLPSGQGIPCPQDKEFLALRGKDFLVLRTRNSLSKKKKFRNRQVLILHENIHNRCKTLSVLDTDSIDFVKFTQNVTFYALKSLSELTFSRHFRRFDQNINFGIVKTTSSAMFSWKSEKLKTAIFPKKY